MAWVLVLWMSGGVGSGGPAMHDFTTQERCVAAGEAAKRVGFVARFECVLK